MISHAGMSIDSLTCGIHFRGIDVKAVDVIVSQKLCESLINMLKSGDAVGEIKLKNIWLRKKRHGCVDPGGDGDVSNTVLVSQVIGEVEVADALCVERIVIVVAGNDDIPDVAMGVNDLAGSSKKIETAAVDALVDVFFRC